VKCGEDTIPILKHREINQINKIYFNSWRWASNPDILTVKLPAFNYFTMLNSVWRTISHNMRKVQRIQSLRKNLELIPAPVSVTLELRVS
jgi:hypothetical protein